MENTDLQSKFMSSVVRNFLHEKFLLAISGGIDSMVMLHLFMKEKLNIGIAHCNFNLRGKESDGDAEFINAFAVKNNIPVYIQSFNTQEYAENNGISIQMAARDLRYNWFHVLLKEHHYDKLALAHNQNDNTETFFINLLRGTGLKGIKGMPVVTENMIRPMIQINRKEIETYALQHSITYREDSTNKSTKYLRNKLRHQVIPLFEEMDDQFHSIMNENLKRFEKAYLLYNETIEKAKAEICVVTDDGQTKISLPHLKKLEHVETILFETLSPFQFTQSVVNNILQSLDHQSGLRFFSSTHSCIKDRDYLIISKTKHTENRKYYLEETQHEIEIPIRLQLQKMENSAAYSIEKGRNIAQLDLDKLLFPLILRKWEQGDYFMPLGMTNYQKLSDFFINNKFSLFDKKNTWILTSGEKIVWIAGHRIDERFKIDDHTKNILKITKV